MNRIFRCLGFKAPLRLNALHEQTIIDLLISDERMNAERKVISETRSRHVGATRSQLRILVQRGITV